MHLVVEAPEPVPQVGADLRVQRPEGLVEEQHPRVDGEGPGEGHPLALATGELGRVAVLEPVEADDLEQLVDLAPHLGLRAPADRQPEGHVVAHRHVLEGRVVLEHEADTAPLRRFVGHVHPAIEMTPLSIPSRPAMARSRVDLPDPLGPSSAVSEPEGMVRLTSSSATKSP